jgi:hypothetical protein
MAIGLRNHSGKDPWRSDSFPCSAGDYERNIAFTGLDNLWHQNKGKKHHSCHAERIFAGWLCQSGISSTARIAD